MRLDQDPASVERLHAGLRRARRHGVRAAQLLTYSKDLIDALCPAERPGVRLAVRAMKAEDIIRKAVLEIGGTGAEALLIVLALQPGTLEKTLNERRRVAAACLGVQPATFRRDHHENLLLLNLAIEIVRLAAADADDGGQAPTAE